MKKLLASLSLRQRISIAAVAVLVAVGLFAFVHSRREADFRPLVTGLAPEDAAGVVQKLKEAGVEYRLPENGGSVLVPSSRLAELRLTLAAAGLPKTGRIGFELFDKTNLGATEFAEHVNYRRALEGELERSIGSLAEVEQARVHLTFPKDSVFLEAQQPAKASVLLRLKPGAHMSAPNVQAINHLVASAVEGLSPDAVSVLDMNGNLLGKPKPPESQDGTGPSDAALNYRHQVEADLLTKINTTLEPLLGTDKFRAGVSVDCDFSGGEQSEEVFDPSRSVMLNSQRTEDVSGAASASGVPGTASTLPRPTSRPGSSGSQSSRVTENITYQSSRTVKKMRLPAGGIRKISVAVLLDQSLSWQRDKSGYRRVLTPPPPERIKAIHDIVAGVTGFNQDRGDQLVVESQPFETTLSIEPPPLPPAPVTATPGIPFHLDRKTMLIVAASLAVLMALGAAAVIVRKRRRKRAPKMENTGPAELTAGTGGGGSLNKELESQRAELEAANKQAELDAALKLVPAITKTAEVMAKHIREKIHSDPEVSVQALRTWLRDEDS